MSEYKSRALVEYLPTVLRGVMQYQALSQSEQPEIFGLFEGAQTVLDNMFVSTSTEYGIKRWEKLLGIVPKGTSTLEERKFAIMSRLTEELPFTYRRLEQMMDELCGVNGYKLKLDHAIYKLTVELLKPSAIKSHKDIWSMLARIKPAHLAMDISAVWKPYIFRSEAMFSAKTAAFSLRASFVSEEITLLNGGWVLDGGRELSAMTSRGGRLPELEVKSALPLEYSGRCETVAVSYFSLDGKYCLDDTRRLNGGKTIL